MAYIYDLADTWNNAAVTYTAIKMNVTDSASNASSLLMDLQVGGTSRFRVDKAGTATVNSSSLYHDLRGGTSTANSGIKFSDHAIRLVSNSYTRLSAPNDSSSTAGVAVNTYLGIGPDASNANISPDIFLFRDAANTLAQRNTTNAQTFRIYNTYTDVSNYERAKLEWSSNVLRIGTEKLGTGSARALELQTDGTTRLTISSVGEVSAANRLDALYFLTSSANLDGIGGIYFGSSNANRAELQATGVGVLALGRWGSGDVRFQFGGTTSSFPALKRSTDSLQVRLADDSGDANLSAGNITGKQIYTPTQTLTDGVTISWNGNLGAVAEVTLTGSGRTITPSNLVAGGTYLLYVKQDATGGRTVTTWTNFRWPGGFAPTLSTAANAVDIITGVSDGTYIYASAQIGFA